MNLLIKFAYRFLLTVSLFFSMTSAFAQTADTTRKGPMRIVLVSAGRGTYRVGTYGGSPEHYDRYKEFMEVGDQKYKINRKNLNPFFKQDPEAYKKWNAYYAYSYGCIGALGTSLTCAVLAIGSDETGSKLTYGITAVSTMVTTVIFSAIARKKREKAVKIYNRYWEK
jgi:hypothetical protein